MAKKQMIANRDSYAFVIMPFDQKFYDIYNLGIKVACESEGITVSRVDEQYVSDPIPAHIAGEIKKADVIIAEMTGRNPNVYYEAGYADALEKVILFLTQSASDIPFDLKHRQHIVYGESITELQRALTPKLLWAIEEAQSKLDFLIVDSLPLLGTDGRISKVPYQRYTSVNDFTDDIWNTLSPFDIPPYTYNETWVLLDVESQRVFSEIGRKWAKRNGLAQDNRPLQEVGIFPGMSLEIIKPLGGKVTKRVRASNSTWA